MPIRYSRRTRRLRRPRRRMMRRRVYRNRRLRRTPVHLVKRVVKSTLPITYNANTTFSYIVKLNDLPDYSDFTNLFDQYKISGVKIEIIPRGNESSLSSSQSTQVMSVIDRNGLANPFTENQLLQYQSLRKTPLFRRHVRYYKPAVLTPALDYNATNPFPLSKVNQWISTENPDVDHYGLYGFVPDPGFEANITMDVYTTFYIALRAIK